MNNIIILLIFVLSSNLSFSQEQREQNNDSLELGAFSLSLSVKDLKASKAFYEKLGFHQFAGSMDQDYLIMKNGNTVIGLFQGMFEGNIITFNPGWNQDAKETETFTDVRSIQKRLMKSDIKPIMQADENTEGPASLVIVDPDGNMILFDQHR
jgi:predicted lactoylglutathione lyase